MIQQEEQTMPKRPKADNKFVTSKEFNETKKEFIGRFDKIESNMATKDDIKNMATKDDIKRLAISIIQQNDKINLIEQKMATKNDIKQIITAIDSFASKTEDHERKAIVNTHRINEIEPKVEAHEKRIGLLESHLPPRT